MKIRWSTRALERMIEAAEFAGYDSDARDRFVSEMFESVEHLADFPNSGRVVPEISRDDVREVLRRPFRVIYRVRPDQVEILTLRHMRRPLDPDEIS